MPINSKQKGSRGERELAKILREHGYECRRSQQYAGGTDESADVVGLKYLHIESKRVEKLNIDSAIEQAFEDSVKSKKNNIPVVMHRRNGKEWKTTLYLKDFMKIYGEYYSSMELAEK